MHCLLKMPIATDYGSRQRDERKQDAGDMILFTLNPGPHYKISHSDMFRLAAYWRLVCSDLTGNVSKISAPQQAAALPVEQCSSM